VKLEDGRLVRIQAAPERLIQITTENPLRLMKVGWHLGNRHVATEITADAIYIAEDHVLLEMVRGLGATANAVERPFRPERGAYEGHVHGPDCGHDHGAHSHDHAAHDHGAHDHAHAHDHGTHDHAHAHDHAHGHAEAHAHACGCGHDHGAHSHGHSHSRAQASSEAHAHSHDHAAHDHQGHDHAGHDHGQSHAHKHG
jgi:urease accessory protein